MGNFADDPDFPPLADADETDGPAPAVRTWDPRTIGCRCDRCDLRDREPVPPDLVPNARLTIIAEAPGKHEVEEGRPLVGASGREMNRAIEEAEHHRCEVSADNVILCRIPAKGIDLYTTRLRRRNLQREAEGEEPLLHPFVACAPHLDRTVARSRALLVLGKTALAALTGTRQGEAGLTSQRGFPMTLRGLPAVATWHPAHVLRNRRWTAVFRSDVAKAFRHATGRLEWTSPKMLFNPTVAQLDAALDRLSRKRLVGCDCETEPGPGREDFDPEHDALRCVALGTREFCVSVGFRSVPKQSVPTLWRAPPNIAQERIRNFFSRCVGRVAGPLLVMHNGNVYDRPVLRSHRMPLPDFRYVLDTLPLSRNAWSELGHDLDFLMSWYTDAPKHKGRKGGGKIDHSAWESDKELAVYCMRDVAADVAIFAPLLAEVRETQQQAVFRSDIEMQRFAEGAHRAGMKTDPEEIRRHERRLLLKMQSAQEAANLALARSGVWRRAKPINLASVPQVREFLYDGLMLPIQLADETDSEGDPTTKRDAVYELLQIVGLPDHAIDFCEALLEYRSAARTLSKDIRGLTPDADGRVHPSWGTLGVTGRPQSTDPNVSNVPSRKRDPDSLRSIYVPEPGCVFVYCDLDQVELRAVAALSGDRIWLDLFHRQERGEMLDGRKIDMHKINAGVYFEKKWYDIDPRERDFSKGLTYLLLYGGGPRRALINMRQVVKLADGGGLVRPYAALPLKKVRDARAKFLRVHHWLPTWWDKTVQEWRTDRFLREPILGRVRYFLDGEGGDRGEGEEQRSELINFRAQSATAGWMSGVNAVGTVMREIGWPWYGKRRGMGGRGLIHHGYDSMMVEVAGGRAEEAAKILAGAMATRWVINGNSIAIPTGAKIGRRWSEVS